MSGEVKDKKGDQINRGDKIRDGKREGEVGAPNRRTIGGYLIFLG
jgi:hypothetical protein